MCMYSVCINGSVSQLLCMHGYKLLQLISEPHVTVEEAVSEFPRFEPLEFSQSVTQLVWMSRIIGKKRTSLSGNHLILSHTQLLLHSRAVGGAGALPSCLGANVGTLSQGRIERQTTTANNLALTPPASLDFSVHLTCMLWDSGRKSEDPKGNLCRHMENVQTLHRKAMS